MNFEGKSGTLVSFNQMHLAAKPVIQIGKDNIRIIIFHLCMLVKWTLSTHAAGNDKLKGFIMYF